ncbi:hypothetical protein CDL12_06056 [Handroanthus impetiginosus]|uniref:RRM domain-containing protein n=1 Tax=Handroanthus impetiginosus TaxID=429701 RepID=A0A2G9HUR8_9LAMI|nr:hypothetical protein CDL12_06056 [Handroanthus impetiginosus]
MQQALLQQQLLYHPGLLVSPQIELIPSGNLSPGFDPSTCRSVFFIFEKMQISCIEFPERMVYYLAYADHLKFGLSDAKVMWDQKTGRSRGFGIWICLFREPTEKWLGSRQIRCNWATKDVGTSDDKQNSDAKKDVKEAVSSDAPENNPQYTIVYVGNLAPEEFRMEWKSKPLVIEKLPARQQEELIKMFSFSNKFDYNSFLTLKYYESQRDKGFGFVRYNTHTEAAMAISLGNTQSFLRGKQIKGNKPTPPTRSAPLPGLSTVEILAYERQLAISKMGGVHTLIYP